MANLQEFKCPCCGGAVEFNSSVQKMKCPYCDSEFEVDALLEYQQSLEQEPVEDMSWDNNAGTQWGYGETSGMNVYTCQSCGGEVVADQTTGATSCPYCDSPVVMTGSFSGDLKPDYIIPFKVTKDQAKAALLNHFKGKKLLPKVFKDEHHVDEIKGVYVPYWLFSAKASGNARFHGIKTRHWSDSRYSYTESTHYAVIRQGSMDFEKVPADGSSKMDDALMESLEPFEFKDAVPFQTPYLAGYMADKYDVSAQDCQPHVNNRIKSTLESSLRNTVQGYQTVTTDNCSVQISDCKTDYALYPVWILNTSWNGTNYQFAMNGQTGKFVGDLPADKGIARKYFWSVTAAVGVVCYLIAYLLH